MAQSKFIFAHRALFITTAVLLCLGAFSCAAQPELSSPHRTASGRIIKSVPFFPQDEYQCGPAAMASVLNYEGMKVSPEEIAAEIYSKSARGTLNFDMLFYAQKKGGVARHYEGSLADLKHRIDKGHPVIVMVDYGFFVYQKNHFMVVVGYDDDNVIVHSGRNRCKSIRTDDFLKTWQKTRNWTLLIQKANADKP